MKPRVLMIAYACDPQGTGEHWLGWGWAEQAAKRYQVDLITTPKSRDNVEESCRTLGITPHFVSVPGWLRKATEAATGGWLRKLAWQKRVLTLAETLHREKAFAVVHQTTFHTFRVPFLATGLGVPSVWGPIAGGEHVPPGFGRYLGPDRFSENARAMANRIWLKAPSINRSFDQASAIFVSNRTTLNFVPSGAQKKCVVVPPNALRPQDEAILSSPLAPRSPSSPAFQLLYVGNCVATRAIPLVLDALNHAALAQCQLSIVGEGPALPRWKEHARHVGLADKVRFVGKVPHSQLSSFYNAAGALVFPALRDSGGSALLEAMARGLPVICLDWAGPGEMVDSASGIKVPVSHPDETVRALAASIQRLQEQPELRRSLALQAQERARTLFSWEAKYRLLCETYDRLMAR